MDSPLPGCTKKGSNSYSLPSWKAVTIAAVVDRGFLSPLSPVVNVLPKKRVGTVVTGQFLPAFCRTKTAWNVPGRTWHKLWPLSEHAEVCAT